jgi:hypothetical protein
MDYAVMVLFVIVKLYSNTPKTGVFELIAGNET